MHYLPHHRRELHLVRHPLDGVFLCTTNAIRELRRESAKSNEAVETQP